MLQLVQNLRDGNMMLLEVPIPKADPGTLVIQNVFSAISTGTEGNKVTTARANLLTKAQQKPEQVKQVIDSIKTEGLFPTINKVKAKLDSPSPLGYSCVGKVIAIGEGVSEYKIGDIVACGGDGANHAEYTKNRKNLCVKVPANVKMEDAAFTTIGAIALQGIRQAELKLGEYCAVIGLGLLGQLTIQMLKASGIKVIGIDIDKRMVDIAHQSGVDFSILRTDNSLEGKVIDFTDGFGVDAIIITAGTSSVDPIELSGKIARQKGKVIIVGAVPTGFSRENYFKKELDLRMSCSYGPGRYDLNYEEKGIDFPYGYVRWTENRNMQAFLSLIADGKIDLSFIITHRFTLNEMEKAYSLIIEKSNPYIGIIFSYGSSETKIQNKVFIEKPIKNNNSSVDVGFIGVGSFAQKFLLPTTRKKSNLIGVYDSIVYNAMHIGQKYGFNYATGDFYEIINDPSIDTVFIATRHNDHAIQVIEAIKNNKNVFVEKPLCLYPNELEEIAAEYQKNDSRLMVGFNRRFSPFIKEIKENLSNNTPIAINYRINAGFIPANSWFQDKEIGGGRIVGEVCHFLDLVMFIAGSKPKTLQANAITDPLGLLDTLNISLSFNNGSIANVSYFSNGSKELKKEYLEVFCNGITAVVDDFKELHIYGKKHKRQKLINQNKGHKNEVNEFLDSIRNNLEAPIPFDEVYWSTKMAFDVIHSITNRKLIIY